ncbi:hypothetical protein ACNYS0_20935 [Streptomyces sp. BH034]|uniref:hypothetical protein n=1 Tax=Streptomyces sp. BH034 TaxID=3402626 RepID=UPI003BB61990
MARVRLIGPEAVVVPELGGRTVEPDEIVEVPDERFEAYVCQTATWEPVEEPKPVAVTTTAKKAAKPQKDEV